MALAHPEKMEKVAAFIKAGQLLNRAQIIRDVLVERGRREPDFDALVNRVNEDHALTQRLIFLANSAWFAGTVKVDSCASALTRCGSEEFSRLTIYSAVRQALAEVSDIIWPQLEFSAQFCEAMAQQVQAELAEVAHWAGLFHDYAIPFMAKGLTDYTYLMPDALGCSPDAVHNEQECYGMDHTQVGAEIVRSWGFPEAVAEAVAAHHRAKQLTEGLSPMGAKLAALLMITKLVEAEGKKSPSGSGAVLTESKLAAEAGAALGLSHKQLKELVAEACNVVAVKAGM